jgi:hypothetical protein
MNRRRFKTTIEWETFTRRTNDPKLAYLERLLDAKGIPHRRSKIRSFHAPILQVPKEHMDAAWEVLTSRLPGFSQQMFDEMDDDHPLFIISKELTP